MVGRIRIPKDVYILSPETYGKMDFTDMIKVRDLEIGDHPGLSSGPNLVKCALES